MDWEEKSNNQILLEIKQLQLDFEAQKQKTLREYDKLIELENKFNEANKIMSDRLKGVK